VLHDFRYALRALRRNPGFTAIAVLSLGLGIGATTTIYSVIDALDFRPLPYRDADRLVALRALSPPTYPGCGSCPWSLDFATAADWRAQAHSFGEIALLTRWAFGMLHGDTVQPFNAAEVSSNFFSLLGVRPRLGRDFIPDDTLAGAERVALVTDEYWRSRLGADPHAIGSRLTPYDNMSDRPQPMTVIGVLPRGFRFEAPQDVWGALQHGTPERVDGFGDVITRLNDGVTLKGAIAELRTIDARLAPTRARHRDWGATILPLRDLLVFRDVGPGRFALLGIVTFVLLIAVANVAGLSLARTTARHHELSARSALGASHARLAWLLIAEGLCIGSAGGTLGVGLSFGAVRFARLWFETEVTGLTPVVDVRVLLFAVTLSLLAGAATAVLPAIEATRADLHQALRTSSTASAGTRRQMTSDVVVAGLIAGALMLLTGAGLLTRDFLRIESRDIGYDPRGLYLVQAELNRAQMSDPAQLRIMGAEISERLASAAGIRSANVEVESGYPPARYHADDGAESPTSATTSLTVATVEPTYFRGMGIRLVAGRGFTGDEGPGTPAVGILDQSTAALFWPGRSSLGRRVLLNDSASGDVWITVVGVVATGSPLDPSVTREYERPLLYRPLRQALPSGLSSMFAYVRISESPARALPAAMEVVHVITHREVRTPYSLEDGLSIEVRPQQINTLALGGFALFAVLLAATGIYGVVAYVVTRRTSEIGVRMALGARRADVLTLVARRGVVLALGGVVLGLVGSFALSRVLRRLIYETSVVDPVILGACALLMIVVTLIATYLPARRATLVDPAQALRESL
jgi:predicted permease